MMRQRLLKKENNDCIKVCLVRTQAWVLSRCRCPKITTSQSKWKLKGCWNRTKLWSAKVVPKGCSQVARSSKITLTRLCKWELLLEGSRYGRSQGMIGLEQKIVIWRVWVHSCHLGSLERKVYINNSKQPTQLKAWNMIQPTKRSLLVQGQPPLKKRCSKARRTNSVL